jgi:ComEC/Rec2-related protein
MFNIRPICFWAALAAFCLWLGNYDIMWAILGVFGAVFGLFLCQFGTKTGKILGFFGTSRAFFVTSIAICLTVLFSFSIYNLVYENTKTHAGTHTLNGVVESYNLRTDGASYLTLSDAKFGEKKLSGRVIVFVKKYKGEPHAIETGRRVSFNTQIKTQPADAQNINARVKYQTTVPFVDIDVGEKVYTPKHIVWRYSKSMFENCMSYDNAQLLQSMLFGDKSTLDGEISVSFRVGGLIHALAVSGMNVALIVGMLVFIFKICHLRKKFQFPIITAVLLLYCYLCDWQFPILRATIMFLVILVNRFYFHKADLLSCLCLSAIITLVIWPHALWSWSFQLSYACMFGIALFYAPLEKLRIWAIVNMYLCATIGTFPLLVSMFGMVPTYGLLTNILLLPILAIGFQISMFSICTWVGQILLYPLNPFMTFVIWACKVIWRLPGAVTYLTNGAFFNLFFFVGLIFCTRFINLKKPIKIAAAITCFTLYSIGFLVYL